MHVFPVHSCYENFDWHDDIDTEVSQGEELWVELAILNQRLHIHTL